MYQTHNIVLCFISRKTNFLVLLRSQTFYGNYRVFPTLLNLALIIFKYTNSLYLLGASLSVLCRFGVVVSIWFDCNCHLKYNIKQTPYSYSFSYFQLFYEISLGNVIFFFLLYSNIWLNL